MTTSPTSPETSMPNKPFGSDEIRYWARLAPALQNPPMPDVIKAHLERAQAEGLDPRRLYEAAVASRPPHWIKAPPYEDVAP